MLSARPYAFLDDAPLEERRTQAVMAGAGWTRKSASDLGRLDPEAIARVRAEAWPDPVNAEELHDALLWLGCLTEAEARRTPGLERLARGAGAREARRAPEGAAGDALDSGRAADPFQALWPDAQLEPADRAAGGSGRRTTGRADQALVEILRGRLEGLGPVTPDALCRAARA